MIKQFSRYSIAGAVGTTAHYALLFALVSSQMVPALATAIGAAVGACVNYTLCKRWVFEDTDQASLPQTFRFLITALISISLCTAVMALLAESTGVWIAQMIATALAMLVGYRLNRCWTFHILPRRAS